MAGELHEISRALGALEANTATLLEGQKEMAQQLATVVPTVHSIHTWVETEGKPEISAMRKARWVRYGFTVGVGSVSGFVGSIVAKIPALASFLH